MKKTLEKTPAENKVLADLANAAAKKRLKEKFTVGVYVPKLKDSSFYGVPFYAKTDTLAALAFRSVIEAEPDSSLVGADLYFIGYYDGLNARVSSRDKRLITY